MNKLLEKLLNEAYEIDDYGRTLCCRHCKAGVHASNKEFYKVMYNLWMKDELLLIFPHDGDCIVRLAEREYENLQKRLSTRRRRIIRALSFR